MPKSFLLQVFSSKFAGGQILVLILIFFAVVMILSAALFQKTALFVNTEYRSTLKDQAITLADSGLEYGVWKIQQNANWEGTSSPIKYGAGEFEIKVLPEPDKAITSTAYIPDKTNYVIKQQVTIGLEQGYIQIPFYYALASIGLDQNINIGNGNVVEGDVFSANTIYGSMSIGSQGYDGIIVNYCNYTKTPVPGDEGTYVFCGHTNQINQTYLGNKMINFDDYYPDSSSSTCSFYDYFKAQASNNNSDCNPEPPPIDGAQTHNCQPGETYIIDDPDEAKIGPVYFPCNVVIESVQAIVQGIIYIEGTLTIQNSGSIYLDSAFQSQEGDYSTMVIVNGKINFSASTSCVGRLEGINGNEYLYLLFITKFNRNQVGNAAVTINCERIDAAIIAQKGMVQIIGNGVAPRPYVFGGIIGYSIFVSYVGSYPTYGNNFYPLFSWDSNLSDTRFISSARTGQGWKVKKGSYLLVTPEENPCSLVGYWKFEETSGMSAAADSSDAICGENYGTKAGNINGPQLEQAGKIGNAFLFEKDNYDYVSIGYNDILVPPNGLTVDVWFKRYTAGSGYQAIIHIGDAILSDQSKNSYELVIKTDNKLYFEVSDGSEWSSTSSENALTDFGWYHAVGTWNGTTNPAEICLYLNDTLQGTCQSAPSSINNNGQQPLNIGRLNKPSDPDGGLWYFDGIIDEVKIYNKAIQINP